MAVSPAMFLNRWAYARVQGTRRGRSRTEIFRIGQTSRDLPAHGETETSALGRKLSR
jgi:hypothetical protein